MGMSANIVERDRRETLGGPVGLSLALHALLFLSAFGYTFIGFHFGGGWGRNWGEGGSMKVSTVSSLPGVPLPAPVLATRSTLATQNPGMYQSESLPEAPKTSTQVEIPKFDQETKPEKVVRVNKKIQKESIETPENAVPFGVGGKPLIAYSQFSNTAGEGGLNFGEAAFGDRYTWYVTAVRNRISANWLLTMISPSILSAPRVYLAFDVLRDGTITNVQVVQSSGVAEVDRSALRAVLASNPLAPLPPDYAGSRVSVKFYFDFRRR